MINAIGLHRVGKLYDVAKISVTDSATSHTVTEGKRTVIFQNHGDNICMCGGSTVNYANNRGYLLTPMASMQFDNTTNDFKIYFVCASGLTTTIGVVECD